MIENNRIMKLLNRARSCRFEIDAQLLHIERLHNVIERTRDLTRVNIYTERLAALEAKINASINRAADAESEAQHMLDGLNSEEKAVLYRYYILGEDWRLVADKLHICERNVYIIRKRALERLEIIYNEMEKCNEI